MIDFYLRNDDENHLIYQKKQFICIIDTALKETYYGKRKNSYFW